MTEREKDTLYERAVALMSDFKVPTYDTITALRLYAYLFKKLGTPHWIKGTDDGFTFVDKKGETNAPQPIGHPIEEKKVVLDGKKALFKETVDNIIKNTGGFLLQWDSNAYYIIADNMIIRPISDNDDSCLASLSVTSDMGVDELEKLASLIKDSAVLTDGKNAKNSYRIAYRGQYSIETTICDFDNWDADVKANYNDDIPYKEMTDIIRSDKAALMLFYGEPGTGKTSLIKTLINDNTDKDFIFIDSSICDSISDGHFLDFMNENRNCVLVFEDSEKMLQSRDEGVNHAISTILNLTDGLIAESMKLKFICTFNCDIKKVDKALMRKGRMSLKYEFKKLSLDKVKNIYPDATKAMTLADAYNASKKNDFSEETEKKIGFA